MVKKLYFFIACFFIFLSCQKNNENNITKTRFFHKYDIELTEKEWEEQGKTGKIKTILNDKREKIQTYKNGFLDGKTTITYPNSNKINILLLYKNNTLTKKIIYDRNFIPISEIIIENNNKKITHWYKEGIPLKIEEYENGLLLFAQYFNHKNELESSIKDGNGIRIKRTRDNVLLSKEKIEKGKIVSRTNFHPNNQIQSQTFFKDYMLHGLQTTFSIAGNLLTKTNWHHGKKDGIQLCFRNKKKYLEIPYIHGKKHGVEKEYNIDEKIIKEIHWQNGLRHGSARYYHDEFTDIQWYWKGNPVDLKKFQALEFRKELMAELEKAKSEMELR